MLCERCNVEMEKRKFQTEGLAFGNWYSFEGKAPGAPVEAKSVFICPQCGKIEFNINS